MLWCPAHPHFKRLLGISPLQTVALETASFSGLGCRCGKAFCSAHPLYSSTLERPSIMIDWTETEEVSCFA